LIGALRKGKKKNVEKYGAGTNFPDQEKKWSLRQKNSKFHFFLINEKKQTQYREVKFQSN
jgi:hypothetical protein